MIIELFIESRPDMVPNYELDPITAVYISIHNEMAEVTL